jgi:hypothetical protein
MEANLKTHTERGTVMTQFKLTKKAQDEITKLQEKKINLEAELRTSSERRNAFIKANGYDRLVVAAYDKEHNRINNQLFATDEKIQSVEAQGVSTGEKNAIVRAATGWVLVRSDRSLGCSGATKVGFFKPLGAIFEVTYTRYKGFMRNVKGCGSLADTTSVTCLTRLTDAEAQERIKTVTREGFTAESRTVTERTPEEVVTIWNQMIA